MKISDFLKTCDLKIEIKNAPKSIKKNSVKINKLKLLIKLSQNITKGTCYFWETDF
jgi:hypothetical protein